MQIDWTTAPAWAQWHAFDSNGYGHYYQYEPKQTNIDWLQFGHQDRSWRFLPTGQDWRDSLVKRPEQEKVK